MWRSRVRSFLLGSTKRRSCFFPRDKGRVLSKTLLQSSLPSVTASSSQWVFFPTPTSSLLPRLFTVDSNASAREADAKKIDSVVELLQGSLEVGLGSRLDELDDLVVNDAFVIRVVQSSDVSGVNLVRFFKWAFKRSDFVKSSSLVNLLVKKVCGSPQLSRKEAYALWDFIKEVSVVDKELITVGILNQLISTFVKLGKNNVTIEVFNMFEDLDCVPDGDTYYLTIRGMGKKPWADSVSAVCSKMVDSKIFPDEEKVGKIIKFLCRSGKAREAFLVYSTAKEDGKSPPTEVVVSLINHLSRKPDTIHTAFELLDSYSGESPAPFASVISGLYKINDTKNTQILLDRILKSDPSANNTVLDLTITGLAKDGSMESARALLNEMKSRGLKPNPRAYNVMIGVFSQLGQMDEARKMFDEAKKTHSKLGRVSYHILTQGYNEIEEFENGLKCFYEMKEDGIELDVDDYRKLIESLCQKALDWRTGRRLLEEMQENGVQVNRRTRKLVAMVEQLEDDEISRAAELASPE